MADYNPDTDPRSSNSLIRAYLASKGYDLNGGNVRRAVEGNAANPGLIPGLVNSRPSTDAEDQAAMAAHSALRGGGGRAVSLPVSAGRELDRSADTMGGFPTGVVPDRDPLPTGTTATAGNTSAPPAPASMPSVAAADTAGGAIPVAGAPQPPVWANSGGPGVAPTPGIGAADMAGVAVPGGGAGAAPGAGVSAADIAAMVAAGGGTGAGWWLGSRGGAPPPGTAVAAPPPNYQLSLNPRDRVSLGNTPLQLPPPSAGALPPPAGGPPGLGGPGTPLSIGAPAPQIAGPPGPQADTRPIANPNEAIPQPGPTTSAIDKAVGGEGDVVAPPRRARAPRARVKVPKL
jgi:hypothetical protein